MAFVAHVGAKPTATLRWSGRIFMGIECGDKFKILYRDNFTCRYCGSRPGSENLEVDHVIPRSRNGSDNPCNLVAACVTCNRRKSGTIIFPVDMIERDDTEEGWKIHKSFGVWAIKFNDEQVVIEDNTLYWFDVKRLTYDHNFVKYTLYDNVNRFWERSRAYDFLHCLQYVYDMIAIPEGMETI
jgi:hypothetical protein